MQTCIRTVFKEGNGKYEEKRSRFISRVFPVSTEEAAMAYLAELAKEYWDASHRCYAYIINNTGGMVQRFSDDGEPSGTAGLPILEAIRKKELTNVLVVVIRYFGGILLGASGLVRAYGKAAIAGLDDAGIIFRKLCFRTVVQTEYFLYGKIQNLLATYQYAVSDTRFSDLVEIELFIEPEKKDMFDNQITELTGGQAKIYYQERTYVNFDQNGKYIG
jgi:uncharacterized YigZ family protein